MASSHGGVCPRLVGAEGIRGEGAEPTEAGADPVQAGARAEGWGCCGSQLRLVVPACTRG